MSNAAAAKKQDLLLIVLFVAIQVLMLLLYVTIAMDTDFSEGSEVGSWIVGLLWGVES